MTAPVNDENLETQETEEPEVEETEEEQEVSVEELQKQIADLQKSLDKANKERTRLGKKIKETPKTEEAPELSDRAKRVLVTTALRAEGLTEGQAKKLAKLYDLNDLELDEDDNVVGIDFTDLREEFPQLFEKASGEETPKKPAARKVDTGNKKNTASPTAHSDVTKAMLGQL